MNDTDWKIGGVVPAPGMLCICWHVYATHGSNGKICCRCSCKQFVPAEIKGEIK